jgi:hypothetical protein
MTSATKAVPCDVCHEAGRHRTRLVFGERVIHLCPVHARVALRAEPLTLEALRELFRVEGEKRSPLPRRAIQDRRMFPPRPEGRRASDGRRATDLEG